MPVSLISSLIVSESEKLISSFLFESAKSYLNDGLHVHYISKSKIQDVPQTIHGSLEPEVHLFSRLTLKYLEDIDQLVEYATNLQLMHSRKGGKPPRVVLVQDLEHYFENDIDGAMAFALFLRALQTLSCTLDCTINLLAGFGIKSNKKSAMTVQFLMDNFFTCNWHLKVEGQNGTITKMEGTESETCTEIKFKVENDVIFLDGIFEIFKEESQN